MRLLVLGGTGFVGRHIVEHAIARGDEITLFNRGRTAPGLFPGAELLRGDRAGDLRSLRDGGPWDAAIDVTGYHPEHVAASCDVLAGRVGHLTFISTISVYDDVSRPGVDEDAPLAAVTGRGGGEDYGALKALCERVVLEATSSRPTRALIVRPGIVAGPHDPTNRFSAWVERMARGGRVLAPGAPDRPIQLIDARDLAAFVVQMTATPGTGVFNAVGADLAWGDMLAACTPAGSDAEPIWVSDDQLRAAGIDDDALPLWVAADDADNAGFMRISAARAVAAGLRHRPLEDTARDTRAVLRPGDRLPLDPSLEARVVG